MDNFAIEDIPTKMIMIDPYTGDKDSTNLIVYHSGILSFFNIYQFTL